jgi:hypothetical protein
VNTAWVRTIEFPIDNTDVILARVDTAWIVAHVTVAVALAFVGTLAAICIDAEKDTMCHGAPQLVEQLALSTETTYARTFFGRVCQQRTRAIDARSKRASIIVNVNV